MAHAVIYKKEKQIRIYLWFYVLTALVTIPVFLTGDPAGDLVKKLPGISDSSIDAHETFGYVSLVLILLLGIAALAAIRFFRNREFLPKWFKYTFIIVAFISVLAVSWTGKTGGEIRHSEITTGFVTLK
jgi:amino acid transporter